MVNSVVLVGRCDSNPFGDTTPKGESTAFFSLRIETAGHVPGRVRISLRGKAAQIAMDYVKAGMLVGVQGRLVLEACGDGSIEIEATNIRLLGSKAA